MTPEDNKRDTSARRLRRAAQPSLLLVCAVLALSGCGTLSDLFGDDRRRDKGEHLSRVRGGRVRIYGGIRFDLEILGEAKAGWMLAFYAIDLPISLTLDTLLLPFTIPYNLSR